MRIIIIIILMTIQGIDYYSAMIVKNEIGEIKRFPGYKELIWDEFFIGGAYATSG